MNNDEMPSDSVLMHKNKQINTNKTLDQLEAEHGARSKSAEQLASQAFQPDSEPVALPEHKGKKTNRLKAWWQHLSKKQKIIIGVIAGVLLLSGTASAWYFLTKKPAPAPAPVVVQPKEEPKSDKEPSRLTGVLVPPKNNKRTITAVMIENSPDARPQSGLTDAGVVFEAVAEGGVTRFVALFQDDEPKYIGPVRSARPYFIEWMLPFDAGYAHVGGSPDALSLIKSLHVRDLDQFYNSGAYQRITSRYAPHNAYTGIPQLQVVEKQKGYTSSNFTGFTRGDKEHPTTGKAVTSINMELSGYYYNTHWDYDKKTNSYKRSEGGKPHTDEKSGKQITSKVVIALVTQKGTMADGYHSTYKTTGSGAIYVFQDGKVTQGTWKKSGQRDQLQFFDTNGNPFKLNPGQTWVTAVGSKSEVSYR